MAEDKNELVSLSDQCMRDFLRILHWNRNDNPCKNNFQSLPSFEK